jgi:Sec-independent protein secretion pathway component TatC
MLALGAMFEIPVLLLALGRAGVLSSANLRRHRGYAIVGLSILGALLPGTDPVSTLLETLPLFALYEATIVLLRLSERSGAGRSGSPVRYQPGDAEHDSARPNGEPGAPGVAGGAVAVEHPRMVGG